MDNKTDQIGGYSYGAKEVANSPVSLEELEQLKQTVTQKHEDVGYLRMVWVCFRWLDLGTQWTSPAPREFEPLSIVPFIQGAPRRFHPLTRHPRTIDAINP